MMRILSSLKRTLPAVYAVFHAELHRVKSDAGVLIFFILVPLAYPLLYAAIYTGEVVRDVPAVAVDADHTAASRDYLRRVDGSPDVKIVAHCADMEEARELLRRREAYGIIFVPENFSGNLAKGEQAYVNIFTDMSGLLYYKAMMLANTEVSLEMNAEIKVARAGNTTEMQDELTEHPIAYAEVSMYNPQGGFASFLIPAVLVLILQQTLLLGAALAAGTERDQNRELERLSLHPLRHGTLATVFGKTWAYMLVYIPVSAYVLGVVPRIFSLNQIGSPWDIACLTIPFLLATCFFSFVVARLFRRRESCMLVIVFTSVPLLFLSGVSWPAASIPTFWKYVSYIFPSTFGINGFIKINNMGASLTDVRPEMLALWLQTFYYLGLALFLTARYKRKPLKT